MSVGWCDWRGEPQSVATPTSSPVLVSQCSAKASAKDVLFRDPESFVAGEIHRHVGEWEKILGAYSKQQEVLHYIRHKVNVRHKVNSSSHSGGIFKVRSMILLRLQRWYSLTINLASDLSGLFPTPSCNAEEMAPFLFGEGLARFLLLTSLCPLQSNRLSQECAMTSAS